MTDRPAEEWLADIIGARVRLHESWEDCTCSEDDYGTCWYHLTKAEQDAARGRAVLSELEMEDLEIVRKEET